MKLLLNFIFLLVLVFAVSLLICIVLVDGFRNSLSLSIRVIPYTIIITTLVFGLFYTKSVSYGTLRYFYIVLIYLLVSVIIASWAWFYGESKEENQISANLHEFSLVRQGINNRIEYLYADILDLESDYLRYNWQNSEEGQLQSYAIALSNKILEDTIVITPTKPNAIVKKIYDNSSLTNFSSKLLRKIEEKRPKRMLAFYYSPIEIAYRYARSEELRNKNSVQRLIRYVLLGMTLSSIVLLIGLFSNMLLVLSCFVLIYMYLYTLGLLYISSTIAAVLLLVGLLGLIVCLLLVRVRAIEAYKKEEDDNAFEWH